MRLFSEQDNSADEEIAKFSKWILDVGDGKINEPNSGETMIDIPEDLLITQCDDSIEATVSEVYGTTLKDSKDPIFFRERAILCPTNEDVDVINNYMLDHLTGNIIFVSALLLLSLTRFLFLASLKILYDIILRFMQGRREYI